MFQITTDTIPEEILNKYIPIEINLKEKLIRKINEIYQYSFEAFNAAQKNDYSFIDKIVESHIFHYC